MDGNLLVPEPIQKSPVQVYETRENALKSVLKKLAESPNEIYNFEGNVTTDYFDAWDGAAENGIPYDIVQYQRDKGSSWYGVLRFFRHGSTCYILRAEIPASEKQRGQEILLDAPFMSFHIKFIRTHWEGNDKYVKGNPERMLLSVRDELQNHDSKMQYAKLELTLKSILAQAENRGLKNIYGEAMNLLLVLREKQQKYYNNQKLRWMAAVQDGNVLEKQKIKNESEAVFSITGDKRRSDILRGRWE